MAGNTSQIASGEHFRCDRGCLRCCARGRAPHRYRRSRQPPASPLQAGMRYMPSRMVLASLFHQRGGIARPAVTTRLVPQTFASRSAHFFESTGRDGYAVWSLTCLKLSNRSALALLLYLFATGSRSSCKRAAIGTSEGYRSVLLFMLAQLSTLCDRSAAMRQDQLLKSFRRAGIYRNRR